MQPPQSGTNQKAKPPSIVSVSLVSVLLLCVIWSLLLGLGDNTLYRLQKISSKFEGIDIHSGTHIVLVILASSCASLLCSSILIHCRYLFFTLLLLSFSLSEVRISIANEIAFILRYLFMLVLTSLGITALFSRGRPEMTYINIIAFIYLFWCSLNVFINGITATSLAMLPVQYTLVLGIIIGLHRLYQDEVDIERLCKIMGWTGAALTIFYLASILIVDQPFLAGRFRSFFLLPTNFSNTYILFYVAMIWLGLSKGRLLRAVLIWTALGVGICLLALSATRNPFLFLIASIGVFSLVWRVKVPVVIALFTLLFLTVIFLYYQESRQIQFLADRLSSFASVDREVLWQTSWSYITNRPWLGYGLGSQLSLVAKMPDWGKLNTHNAYLGIWLQLGLVGVVSVTLLYLDAIQKGLSCILMKSATFANRNVIALPTALLAGLFISGFFEENMTSRGSIQQFCWGISVFAVMKLDCIRKIDKDI